jgi:hypothetical protein
MYKFSYVDLYFIPIRIYQFVCNKNFLYKLLCANLFNTTLCIQIRINMIGRQNQKNYLGCDYVCQVW